MAKDTEHVCCRKCGTQIGVYVDLDGMKWLLVGGMILRNAMGVCGACGEPWYWSVGDRMLAELVQRVLALRESAK